MTEYLTPFLLCINKNKIADIIQKLDDYQRKNFKARFEIPFYLNSKDPDIIDTPEYNEQRILEINREMSKPPSNRNDREKE